MAKLWKRQLARACAGGRGVSLNFVRFAPIGGT